MDSPHYATLTIYYSISPFTQPFVKEMIFNVLEATIEGVMETKGNYYEMDWYFDHIENNLDRNNFASPDDYDAYVQAVFEEMVNNVSQIVRDNEVAIVNGRYAGDKRYESCAMLNFTDSFMTLGVFYEGNYH